MTTVLASLIAACLATVQPAWCQSLDPAENLRLVNWRTDINSNLDLMRIRSKNSALTRPTAISANRLLGLKTFNLMTNPILKAMKNGFPKEAVAAGVLPSLFWWIRMQGTFCAELRSDKWVSAGSEECKSILDAQNCAQKFHIQFFNTLLHQTDWRKLIESCDEFENPRCSWNKFLGFLDPLAMDHYSQIDIGLVTSWDSRDRRGDNNKNNGPIYYLPYKEKSCYPIRDIETLSAIYLYTFCYEFYSKAASRGQLTFNATHVSKHMRLCPNTCNGNPCSRINYSTGKCRVTGIHEGDFTCSCRHNFVYSAESRQCVPHNVCATFCNKTGTSSCKFNVRAGQASCICSTAYMGRRCDQLNNACFNRDHNPSLVTGNEACRVSSYNENQCKPYTGTNLYRCICDARHAASNDHPYNNCYKTLSSCAQRVCLNGVCIESPDGTRTACQCEQGFRGEHCDQLKGMWSQWSAWTHCSPDCGQSDDDVTRKRRRVCIGDPIDCYGPEEDLEACLNAPRCLESLPPEADALRYMQTWYRDEFLPFAVRFTVLTIAGLLLAKLLERLLSRLLRIGFERWQLRINPPNTMGLSIEDD